MPVESSSHKYDTDVVLRGMLTKLISILISVADLVHYVDYLLLPSLKLSKIS